MNTIILLLTLLQIKHWIVDFVNQSEEEMACKGIYGHCLGIHHSLKHGIGTFVCLLPFTGFDNIAYTTVLAFLDFTIHYHVDYIKIHYGNNDIDDKKFWYYLGLGQLLHQLTYLTIIYLMVN
jgi:hypothetical protein